MAENKWETGVITPICGDITLLITGRGPPSRNSLPKTTSSPLKIGRNRKRTFHLLPIINFQVRAVGFREFFLNFLRQGIFWNKRQSKKRMQQMADRDEQVRMTLFMNEECIAFSAGRQELTGFPRKYSTIHT